MLSSFSVAVFM